MAVSGDLREGIPVAVRYPDCSGHCRPGAAGLNDYPCDYSRNKLLEPCRFSPLQLIKSRAWDMLCLSPRN